MVKKISIFVQNLLFVKYYGEIKHLIADFSSDEKNELSSYLETIGIKALTLAEYIRERKGKCNKEISTKEANKMRTKLQAMFGHSHNGDVRFDTLE